MKTRILLLLAALVALATPATAYDFQVGGLCYNINSNGTSVTLTVPTSIQISPARATYGNLSGALTIPSSVTHEGTTYTVTAIEEWAFWYCKAITEVTIPSSVTTVGNGAFLNCSGLKKVNWNVTDCNDFELGSSAYWNSYYGGVPGPFRYTDVTIINFGNNVKRIPNYLCSSLTGLTKLTIPNSVTAIGKNAFSGCTGVTSVTLSSSLTSIGNSAFSGCTGVTSMPLSSSLTSIGNSAFSGCTGLTSVTIPASLAEIGLTAFGGCTSLATVKWNATSCDYISSSYWSPFKDCSSLKSFVIGSNVKRLPKGLCYGLTGITSVTIPASVTSIGDKAFHNCTNLTTVNWNSTSCEDYSSYPIFYECDNLNSFIIGDNVKRIPRSILYAATKLTSVTIPASVTEMGNSAFYGCTGLTKVNTTNLAKWCSIAFSNNTSNPLYYAKNLYLNNTKVTELVVPSTVTAIKTYAFYNCTSLTSVTLPTSLTEVGNYAFRGCTALATVTVPPSLGHVGNYAFAECTGLSRVNISDIGEWCDVIFDSANANPLANAKNLWLNGEKVTELTLPLAVTSVRKYVFYNCMPLKRLTIPATMTALDNNAFAGCTSLEKVVSRADPANVQMLANVFLNVPVNTCVLRVPSRYADAYRVADQWKDFVNIVPILEGDVNEDEVTSGADVTALYGILLDGAPATDGADVNEDNEVTGADVTALYNLLLGN